MKQKKRKKEKNRRKTREKVIFVIVLTSVLFIVNHNILSKLYCICTCFVFLHNHIGWAPMGSTGYNKACVKVQQALHSKICIICWLCVTAAPIDVNKIDLEIIFASIKRQCLVKTFIFILAPDKSKTLLKPIRLWNNVCPLTLIWILMINTNHITFINVFLLVLTVLPITKACCLWIIILQIFLNAGRSLCVPLHINGPSAYSVPKLHTQFVVELSEHSFKCKTWHTKSPPSKLSIVFVLMDQIQTSEKNNFDFWLWSSLTRNFVRFKTFFTDF